MPPRSTRSRVSSPFVAASAAKSKKEYAKEVPPPPQRQKTLLERWIEPGLPTPRPSFAEAGIQRHGVLRDMAPLGTLPSVKSMKAATKLEAGDMTGRTRRSGPSSVSTPAEEATTPEPTINTPPAELDPPPAASSMTMSGHMKLSRPSSIATPAGSSMTPEPIATTPLQEPEPEFGTEPARSRAVSVSTVDTDKTEEPEEGEGAAQPLPQTPPLVMGSPIRNMPSRPSINTEGGGQFFTFPAHNPLITPIQQYKPPIASMIASPMELGSDGKALFDQEKTDRVVENAVEEALMLERYPTAYALRVLYDEVRGEPDMVRLFEAVYNGWASPSQIVELQKLLSVRKREGKKDRTAEYYFNGDGSDPTPIVEIRTNIDLINPPARPYCTPYTPLGFKSAVSNLVIDPALQNSPFPTSSSASLSLSPHRDSIEHIRKKHRSNSFEPVGGEARHLAVDHPVAGPAVDNRETVPEVDGNEETHHDIDMQDEAPTQEVNGHEETTVHGQEKVDGLDQADDHVHDVIDDHGEVYEEINGHGEVDDQVKAQEGVNGQVNGHTEAHDQVMSKEKSGRQLRSPKKAKVNGNVTFTSSPPKPPTGGAGSTTPNKRLRSPSTSSMSSLSSVDEQIIEDVEDSFVTASSPARPASKAPSLFPAFLAQHPVGGVPFNYDLRGAAQPRFVSPYASTSTFAAAASSAETHARNQAQPITAKPKTGPKTYTFSVSAVPNVTKPTSTSPAVPPPSSSITTEPTTDSPPAPDTTSMAPAALLPSSSVSTSSSIEPSKKSALHSKLKITSKLPGPTYDPNDKRSTLKRKAQETTVAITKARIRESRERTHIPTPPPPPTPPAEEIDPPSDGGNSIVVAPSARRAKVPLLNLKGRRTTRGQQRVHDDSDQASSPTVISFQPDLAPGSVSTSRAGTPNHFTRPTRKAKSGSGLRVKSSPMKKKGGTIAGIPRASGERNSPANGVFAPTQDESDDYCSACGGNGTLLCCDNCNRAFHFICVDPPLKSDNLPDTWSCNDCQYRREPDTRTEYDGPFASLLSSLDEKNPSAFGLPKHIREYFENVKTGSGGEYEEVPVPKHKHRNGYEETPDYFRLKDTKGKPILCFQCNGQPHAPDRAVIPCSYCGLYWHLDCLPNPLAKEPNTARPWLCPAHADDLLASLPETLGPAHRFRKIKNAPVIKPAFSRGTKNDGHIEVENPPSDDEAQFYEERQYGQILKLSEMGIKLDFIARVKEMGGGQIRRSEPSPSQVVSQPVPSWTQRSITEQQAALNLAALSAQQPGQESASVLINALLSEAPQNVVALIAKGEPERLASSPSELEKNDVQALESLKALIESKLARFHGANKPATQAEQREVDNSVPSSDDEDIDVDSDDEAEDEVGGEEEKEDEDTSMVL